MKRAIALVALAASLVLLIPAASPMAASAPVGEGTTANRAARQPTLTVRSSRFGRIITDGRGITLYLFTKDSRRVTRCYGSCARAWPPLVVSGPATVAGGLSSALVATTRRTDGKRQVTYRGAPLYYYVGESRPGQIFCQDVFEFGGRWLLMAPAGRAIT